MSSPRVHTFRRLHQSGCFVLPNPWDLGSARTLARLGFPALATTSSGFAWSMGRRDNGVSLEQALSHIRAIAAGVDVPVNADFEGGFAVEPEKLAANFTKATATGVAGLSIEDSTGSPSRPLFDFGLAVERVRAARRASSWVARIWPSVSTRPGSAARPRSPRWSKRWRPTVNVLVGSDFATVAELAEAGVRRISVGGALARAAWTGFLRP